MKINKTIRRIFDGTKIFFELKKFEKEKSKKILKKKKKQLYFLIFDPIYKIRISLFELKFSLIKICRHEESFLFIK